jgi:hypothetical protein
MGWAQSELIISPIGVADHVAQNGRREGGRNWDLDPHSMQPGPPEVIPEVDVDFYNSHRHCLISATSHTRGLFQTATTASQMAVLLG